MPHLGGDGRQIRAARTRLVEIHFLQRQDVRVEEADAAAQSVEMDAVADGAAMQDVEGREAHRSHDDSIPTNAGFDCSVRHVS